MSRHATFKESDRSSVVWLLLEFEGTAVLHELTEFGGVPTAKLLQRSLNLLLLNVVVLLVLGASWEALPG
mgnify:CR=1 FL=1|jgi:hypothetical protein